MYLIPSDFVYTLRPEIQAAVEDGRATKLLKAEMAARGDIEVYLNDRYDLTKIFLDFSEWKDGTHKAGVYVFWKSEDQAVEMYAIYKALQQTNSDPSSETDWIKEDPRHQFVVNAMIDLAVFNFYRDMPGGIVPEDVESAKDDRLMILKGVGGGKYNAPLPQIEIPEGEDDTGEEVWWDTRPKEDDFW